MSAVEEPTVAPSPPLVLALAGVSASAEPVAEEEDRDAIKVYLRVRPLSEIEREAPHQLSFLELDAAKPEITVVPPAISKAFQRKGSDAPCTYNFTAICRQQSTQQETFQKTTLPMVEKMVRGKNALLFTYGVTNSGKTFTVQGTVDAPGLVPRSLDVLFNSIENNQQTGAATVQPYCFCETKEIESEDRLEVADLRLDSLAARRKINSASSAASLDAAAMSAAIDASHGAAATAAGGAEDAGDDTDNEDVSVLDELASSKRLKDQTQFAISDDHKYSVFVSFVEIYNEFVYDLLVPVASKKARRNPCKLGESKDGDVYMKGIREIHVTSSSEALEVMAIGQRNRKMGATQSNKESSRSHCLFTIKLIKIDAAGTSAPFVSQMTIVDLAGSERSNKTEAKGQRLKEAGNINASLMHLGKCLDAIKWNQQQKAGKNQKLIAYRDSKLTRIFKNYFEGKGSMRMVVNISEVSSAYDETAHVLRFSAIARQVSTIAATSKLNTGIAKLRNEIEASLTSDILDLEDYNISLLEKLKALQQQLTEVEIKSSTMEASIRQEVAEEMAEQLIEMEERFEIVASQQANATEAKFEKKWDCYTHSVARLPARSRVAGGGATATTAATAIASAIATAPPPTAPPTPPPSKEDAAAETAELEQALAGAATSLQTVTSKFLSLGADHATLKGVNEALQRELSGAKAYAMDLKRAHAISAVNLTNAEEKAANAIALQAKNATDSLAQIIELKNAFSVVQAASNVSTKTSNQIDLLERAAQQRDATIVRLEEQIARLEAEGKELNDSLAQSKLECTAANSIQVRCDALEQELDEADERTKDLEKARDNFTEQITALEKKYGYDISIRDRKIGAHIDTIETMTETASALEQKNQELQTRLTALLRDQMDGGVEDYVANKPGASFSRGGSVIFKKAAVVETDVLGVAEIEIIELDPSATDRLQTNPKVLVVANQSSSDTLTVPGVKEVASGSIRTTRESKANAASVQALQSEQTTVAVEPEIEGAEVAVAPEVLPQKPKRKGRSTGTKSIAKATNTKGQKKSRTTRRGRATDESDATAEAAALGVVEASPVAPVRTSNRITRKSVAASAKKVHAESISSSIKIADEDEDEADIEEHPATPPMAVKNNVAEDVVVSPPTPFAEAILIQKDVAKTSESTDEGVVEKMGLPSSLMVWSPSPESVDAPAEESPIRISVTPLKPKRKAASTAKAASTTALDLPHQKSKAKSKKGSTQSLDLSAFSSGSTTSLELDKENEAGGTASARKKRKLYKKGAMSPLGDADGIDVAPSSSSRMTRFFGALTPRRLRSKGAKGTAH
jgi:kinesin family protein 20